ncbi:hypothetical protein HELRODRAFT_164514 [Helobdella robusta]|uniref:Uncharacterized protein n=1 Tax=Helobdella robusta TaxID=6412 RepID=T1EVI6_HELRO|nr:hypothetical protein HELRODRAFT_164514 [Helobdella robusta]ESN94638.1 hypothetical protein HELRODRAFT_164514 [Helobdella robusta]
MVRQVLIELFPQSRWAFLCLRVRLCSLKKRAVLSLTFLFSHFLKLIGKKTKKRYFNFICLCNNKHEKIQQGKTLSPVKLGDDGNSFAVTQSPILDNLVTSRIQSNYTNENDNNNHATSLKINLKVVQIPKRYFENALVLLESICFDNMLLGIEVVVDTDSLKNVTVFRKIKKCYGQSEGMTILHKISLRLPRYISYKPGFLNKYSVYTCKGFLRFWLLDREAYTKILKEKTNKYFEKSTVHYSTSLQINEPFDRPHRPRRQCLTWFHDLISKLPYFPTCPYEEEVVTAIDFPVALGGLHTGVHRVYAPFNNPALRRKQIEAIIKPKFAFALWLYVDEYCPFGSKDCNVLHHITWNDNFATPQLQINKQGPGIGKIFLGFNVK